MTSTSKTFMTQIDVETLQSNKTIEKIAYKLLINLFSRGNNNAYNIAITKNNGLVTLEDLTQSMYLFLLEHSEEWYLYRTPHHYSSDETNITLVFLNKEIQKEFFKIVSNELYNNIRKHDRKKMWIEIEGEEVKIDDVQGLASHTCIDDVITLSLYQQFCNYLYSVKPKQAKRYIDSINARLQGLKYTEISKTLEIKETSVKKDFQELKKLWKNFNK